MLGAIIGDIVGSRFEWNNIKTKEFEFLTKDCFFTDDSVMTCAIAKALLEHRLDNVTISEIAVKYMQEFGRKYNNRGYGGSFKHWIYSNNPKPYNSWGNGAARGISACGWVFPSIRSGSLRYQVPVPRSTPFSLHVHFPPDSHKIPALP